MAILINELENAVRNLASAILLAEENKRNGNMLYYEHLRTASIQSFEYSYELAIKLMKRHVMAMIVKDSPDKELHFREMLRMAAELDLISNPNEWVDFREERNRTSHGYNVDVAEGLYEKLPAFLMSVNKLLEQFRRLSCT